MSKKGKKFGVVATRKHDLYIAGGILLALGVTAWAIHAKRKGSVEVGPLDQGEFGPADDFAQYEVVSDQAGTQTIKPDLITSNGQGRITSVGPFDVNYGGATIAGTRKKKYKKNRYIC